MSLACKSERECECVLESQSHLHFFTLSSNLSFHCNATNVFYQPASYLKFCGKGIFVYCALQCSAVARSIWLVVVSRRVLQTLYRVGSSNSSRLLFSGGCIWISCWSSHMASVCGGRCSDCFEVRLGRVSMRFVGQCQQMFKMRWTGLQCRSESLRGISQVDKYVYGRLKWIE